MNRFQFVHDHRDVFGVKRLCQVLGVNRSSYYKWREGADARTARQAADQALAERIRAVHADSDGAYGSPRITAELSADGRKINEKRVARVMRKFSIQVRFPRDAGMGDRGSDGSHERSPDDACAEEVPAGIA
ncbi:IS3 family transposase [Streptomyces sp. NPDC002523]